MAKKADVFDDFLSDLGEVASSGRQALEFLPTGAPALDWLLSGRFKDGGVPRGRIVEFFGDPATGKSLIIMNILAEIQKRGGVAFLDDPEYAYEASWAVKLGIDPDKLVLLHSQTVKDHYEAIKKITDHALSTPGGPPLIGIAIDGLAHLTTEHEMSGGMDVRDMTRAQEIRKLFRLQNKALASCGAVYMVSNHMIANIAPYGPKKVTPGGTGVPFAASIRVEISLQEKMQTPDGNIFGVRAAFYTAKQRIAPPFQTVVLSILFDRGLVKDSGIFDLGLRYKVVENPKKGWYNLAGDPKVHRRSEIDTAEILKRLQDALPIPIEPVKEQEEAEEQNQL